jgi:hypothetical protein
MPLERDVEPTTDWVKLQALLPDGWQEQALLCGALKFGRKFTPETLLRTLLMYLCEDASMVTIAERARGGDVVDISDVALLKRMNKSGEWLRWISERLVNDTAPVLLSERRLLAIDGSTISDPYSKTATWRLHYAFDITSLRCHEAHVTPFATGETLTLFNVEKGDVIIADRGFATRKNINHVLDSGSDILVRMNLISLPLYEDQGKKFNQLEYLRHLKVGEYSEWPAQIEGTQGQIPVRVCAYRKTLEQQSESERKLHCRDSKRQSKSRPETIEATAYIVVVTTLREYSAQQILQLYQHRWQVELAFKRMKSLLGLSKLKKKNPAGAKAWIQGKLLVAFLIEKLIATGDHFPPVVQGRSD